MKIGSVSANTVNWLLSLAISKVNNLSRHNKWIRILFLFHHFQLYNYLRFGLIK